MFLLDESYPETIARAMTEDNYKKKQGVKRQVCTTRQRFDERLRAKSSTTFSVISQRWTNRLVPFLISFILLPSSMFLIWLPPSLTPPPLSITTHNHWIGGSRDDSGMKFTFSAIISTAVEDVFSTVVCPMALFFVVDSLFSFAGCPGAIHQQQNGRKQG